LPERRKQARADIKKSDLQSVTFAGSVRRDFHKLTELRFKLLDSCAGFQARRDNQTSRGRQLIPFAF
jgi:hypothetical protein